MVELILFGSDPALVDLSRKPFCSHLFHPSQLDSNQTKKNSPSSYSSLRRPISSHLWPQVSDSTSETIFVSGNGLQVLQRSRGDSRSKFSKRPYRLCFYDGCPFSLLVSSLSNHFLHHCWIYWMDPNLFRPSLSNRCHSGSFPGLWNNKSLYFFLFFKKRW